jgi:hypothetical protein
MNTVNGLSHAQIKELLEPFDHNIVGQRESDNQLIVPHDYVRARLSEIFGPLGWSEQTLELTEVPTGDDGKSFNRYVAYRARVRIIIRNPDGTPGAFWDGAGAWGQGREARDKTAIWDLHSDCMNGALSVAFLRATKNLGNQFGLTLYSTARSSPEFPVRYFLTHPLPQPVEDTGDDEQLETDMQYIPDPETEHAAP